MYISKVFPNFLRIWKKIGKNLENLEKFWKNFGKILENSIFFGGGVLNESEIDIFHRKHKNSRGNHIPLGLVSQFSFSRSLAEIPFVESIDSLHCN